MPFVRLSALGFALALLAQPALAQVTVLDEAQDATAAQGSDAPPPPCGTAPITIARMSWSSAALLADIHAKVLEKAFGCTVSVIPGDLAATASSMGSTGQPAVAPEMWVTRIADVWNGAIEGQMVRSAAPTYKQSTFEGWYVPSFMGVAGGPAPAAASLADFIAAAQPEGKVRFISCPADWACAVINRNLIAAYGLTERFEIVEPANRFEMDALIGEAVSRKQPVVFYYWQPNAVLAQLDFTALDMGAYDEAAFKCLASLTCPDPKPSAFAPEIVVTAVVDRLFTDIPAVAGYFQRASLDLETMDELLAELNETGATSQSVAERFVVEHEDIWRAWTGPVAP
jgi:glycine betaine/proline transport system substrate-binding protein